MQQEGVAGADAPRPRWARRRSARLLIPVFLVLCVLGGCAGCASMVRMPGHSYRDTPPPPSARERALRDKLRADVTRLATNIGERNSEHRDAYRESARWIEAELSKAGLSVRREAYGEAGEELYNLVTELPGAALRSEIVVIGAHYDSVEGTPGANDNGSGVAATLALARTFAKAAPARTLRFVFFADEEPPSFQSADMGSLVYARGCKARDERIVAMLSLETMGFYSDAKDSQHYPWPFNWLYPSTGDFIAFVGNSPSTALTRRAVRVFRGAAALPSEGAAVPDLVQGIGWSDHWSFWQVGYPAVMVTDTALFRYAHYHTAEDTPDKLDYERLARAVVGLEAVVAELTGLVRAHSG
jgi:Peptidase family M28